MSGYNFVGSSCAIGGVGTLEQFGQPVDLPDQIAEIVIAGGCPILPAAEFQSLGFTDQELNDFRFPGPQENAPETFKQKRQEAWVRFCALKARIDAGGHIAAEGGE